MTHHNYLAVVGRVSGDDEDDVLLYEHMTVAQACDAFIDDQREAEATPDIPRDDIYINYVLTSESPITIQERNV